MSDYKPVEPVTFATDMLLAILGLVFGSILLYYYLKNEDRRKLYSLMWVGGFYSVMFFAFFGAISHGTDLIKLADIFWPPTMIFGGISFIFFVAGVLIYQKETGYLKLLIIPIILVIFYLIIGFLINWPFIIWVILLIVCSILIYLYAFRAKNEDKELAPYIIKGLTIIIISGIIQAIGGIIGYQTYFGPNDQYLFTPHNDIFHVIAMIGLYVFFKGFKKDLV